MALILGIDPGSRKTGYGIINVNGNQHDYVTSGVIRLPVEQELPERIKVLIQSLAEIIETHCPQQVAIEQVFMAKNAGSALKLGQARGAAIAACVAIAGSTIIGKRCTLAGVVGVADHVTIADDVHLTGMSMVTGSITEPGVYSSGTGLMASKEWRRSAVRFRQLDDLAKRLAALEKKVTD